MRIYVFVIEGEARVVAALPRSLVESVSIHGS